MHGPDGRDYPNESVFPAASPAEVVIQHFSQPHFTLTITLEDDGGGTMLRWNGAFEDPRVATSMWHIIEPANEQNLNRLHAALSANAVR
jgi:hypothetical protein